MFDPAHPMRVLGISGSLRKGSYNTAALRAAGDLMPDDMTLEIAALGDLPMYNADDERESGFSEPVRRLRDRVAGSDCLLIATPEYNNSITGALKNAIDWLSRPPDSPLSGKPAAIFGVGGRLGSVRAQLHLRDIARYNDLRLVQKPEVLIPGGWDKFDDDLKLIDERARDQLQRLVLALRSLTIHIGLTRKRVLVVETDRETLSGVTTLLRETGYEPVGTIDHEAAEGLVEADRYAAMLIGPGLEAAPRESLRRLAVDASLVVVEPSPGAVLEGLEKALSG
jgi:chromate reductase